MWGRWWCWFSLPVFAHLNFEVVGCGTTTLSSQLVQPLLNSYEFVRCEMKMGAENKIKQNSRLTESSVLVTHLWPNTYIRVKVGRSLWNRKPFINETKMDYRNDFSFSACQCCCLSYPKWSEVIDGKKFETAIFPRGWVDETTKV